MSSSHPGDQQASASTINANSSLEETRIDLQQSSDYLVSTILETAVPPPYLTTPSASLTYGSENTSRPQDQMIHNERDDVSDEDSDDDEYSSNYSFGVSRLIRAERNRLVLDTLLDLLQQNEERMIRFVMDQSYYDSLQQTSMNMQRKLAVDTKVYEHIEDQSEACMICQESFQKGDLLADLQCGHDLHFACLEEWIKRKDVCPFCEVQIATHAECEEESR